MERERTLTKNPDIKKNYIKVIHCFANYTGGAC